MKLMKLSTVSLDDELSLDEIDFFSADKLKSFLQSDSITMGMCSQVFPKCPGFDNWCTLCIYLCLLLRTYT